MPDTILPSDAAILQLMTTIRRSRSAAHFAHAEEHRLIFGACDQFTTAHIKILQEDMKPSEVSMAPLALDVILLVAMYLAPSISTAITALERDVVDELKSWARRNLERAQSLRKLVETDGAKTVRIAMRSISTRTLKPLESWPDYKRALQAVREQNKYLLPLAYDVGSHAAGEATKVLNDTLRGLREEAKAGTGDAKKDEVKTAMGTYPSVRLVDHLLRESNWKLHASLNTLDRLEHEIIAAGLAGTLTRDSVEALNGFLFRYALGVPPLSPGTEGAIVRFFELALWVASYPFKVERGRNPIAPSAGSYSGAPSARAVRVVSKAGWDYLLNRFVDPETGGPFSAAPAPTNFASAPSEDGPDVKFSTLANNLAIQLFTGTEEFYQGLSGAVIWGDASLLQQPVASAQQAP